MSGTAAFHAKPRFSSKASLYVNAPASVMAAEVTLQRTTGRPAEVPHWAALGQADALPEGAAQSRSNRFQANPQTPP
jgi:hypothetical protein